MTFEAYTATPLVLKRRWFQMIQSGEKTEEYREITPYWIKRLFCNRVHSPRHIFRINDREAAYFAKVPSALATAIDAGLIVPSTEAAIFYEGYAKDRPQVAHLIQGIKVGTGRPEWGAEPEKEYLVIQLGERIR